MLDVGRGGIPPPAMLGIPAGRGMPTGRGGTDEPIVLIPDPMPGPAGGCAGVGAAGGKGDRLDSGG